MTSNSLKGVLWGIILLLGYWHKGIYGGFCVYIVVGVCMYELVERILQGVGFIAIGGALALIFFFIFAPSILGSKAIQKQIQHILHQLEQMNEQLKKITEHLKEGKDNRRKHT